MQRIEILPVPGLPEVRPGDDLARLIVDAIDEDPGGLKPGDVLVVTHKVVSKAEGRIVPVRDDAEYRAVAEAEAATVLRRRGDLIITKTPHGYICANAGVDRSNTPENTAVLLPVDPDFSAHRLRGQIREATGIDSPVVVTDTFGRAWRRGLTDVAIGMSGLDAILDLRGTPDALGRELSATEVAIADEIAAAADLAMGKATGVAVVIVRGLDLPAGSGRATDLIRPAAEDMFR